MTRQDLENKRLSYKGITIRQKLNWLVFEYRSFSMTFYVKHRCAHNQQAPNCYLANCHSYFTLKIHSAHNTNETGNTTGQTFPIVFNDCRWCCFRLIVPNWLTLAYWHPIHSKPTKICSHSINIKPLESFKCFTWKKNLLNFQSS